MSNGDLHGREREDLALHVERCAERYGAVQNELSSLRQQVRRMGVLRALAQVATP